MATIFDVDEKLDKIIRRLGDIEQIVFTQQSVYNISTPEGVSDWDDFQGTARAKYVVISANSTLKYERVLTGTANQIILADGGANSTITLSLPQSIHTGASPTFDALTITNNITVGGTVDGIDISAYINQSVTSSASPTFGGIVVAGDGTIGQAAGPLLTFDDSNNYLEITGCSVGIGVSDPDAALEVAGTIHFGPSGAGAIYTWPTGDGTDGQFLKTDGSGALTWTDAPAGAGGDHGGLTGLADDDHTQYFLLAGETVDAKLYGGADLIIYSDGGSTEVGRWDGATGNITLSGTVDGIDIATDVAANTTHRGSDGTDHGFIDQDLQIAASPTFGGLTLNGAVALDGDLGFVGAQSITTTAGDLTLAPTADLILAPTGNDVFIRPSTGIIAELFLDGDISVNATAAARLHFRGHNNAAENVTYAHITGTVISNVDGAEGGDLYLQIMHDGALSALAHFRGGVGAIFNDGGIAALDFRVESDTNTHLIFGDAGANKVVIGGSSPATLLTIDGTLTLKEQAAADADTAAYGQLWVKTATPCELWFTDDVGGDNKVITRFATLVVAANDAGASFKQQADYVCDGTADEVQINAALAALPGVGGSVILSEGTFVMAAAISMPDNSTLTGQGYSTVVQHADNIADNGTVDIRNSDMNGGNSNITITNFKIDVNGANQTTKNMAIWIKNSEDIFINNISVRDNTGWGIRIELTTRAILSDLNIISYATVNSDPVHFLESNHCTLTNSYLEQQYASEDILAVTQAGNADSHDIILSNLTLKGSTDGRPIYIGYEDAADTNVCYNITVSNIVCDGGGCFNVEGLSGYYNHHISFDNISMRSPSMGAVWSAMVQVVRTRDSQFNNIKVRDSASRGFLFQYCDRVTLNNSLAKDCEEHGIHYSYADNSIIANNIITGNGQASSDTYDNILLTNCDYNIITGNTCRAETFAKYGIYIDGGTGNMVHGNHLYASGTLGDIDDTGTDTLMRDNVNNAGTDWV